jgi:threonylcarbamoyladenosine tRNA methylthiotransferase MtaB
MHMPKFKITTLGCKVNQAESDQIAAGMADACWLPVGDQQDADVCIINTCTVTRKASMQSRQAIRRAMRAHPKARILVTGCYAHTDPQTVSDIVGIRGVVSRADWQRIKSILSETELRLRKADEIKSDSGSRPAGGAAGPVASARTRPFLKIQDGCDAFCTYCIVPHARGRSRSMPLSEVIENLSRLSDCGYHEVVLAGIHLGCYGRDLKPAASLFELLQQIENSRPPDRLRLSSIEPLELTEDIISLAAASSCICPHFHIPLQSGDNTILNRMGRPYTAEQFASIVNRVHELLPEAAIGTDVLVGFPSESEEAFEQARGLIKSLPLSYLHVFPFSARPGTPAAEMPGQIKPDVLKERSRKMRQLGTELRMAFYNRFRNRTLKVLVETSRDSSSGLLKGLTANYLPVHLEADDTCQNTLVDVTVTEVCETHLSGRLT